LTFYHPFESFLRRFFIGVPENIQGTIQKILFVTFLKKGNAKNFYM
jgi:hypothetical protein